MPICSGRGEKKSVTTDIVFIAVMYILVFTKKHNIQSRQSSLAVYMPKMYIRITENISDQKK